MNCVRDPIVRKDACLQMRLLYACVTVILLILVQGYFCSHMTRVGKISFLRVEDAFSSLKTGDMIFTKSKNWTSRVQQYFFGAYINHCAMVYKAFDGNLWIWDLAPKVGAYMSPLHEFVRNNWFARPPLPQSPPIGMDVAYVVPRVVDRFAKSVQRKSALFVRRSIKPLDQQLVLEYIQQNLGRPYSWRFWLSAYTRVMGLEFPLGWTVATDSVGMFCSELIAHTFVHANALHPLKSPPSSLLPSHFWENDLSWVHGHGLMPAEQLIGEPPQLQPFGASVEKWEDGVSSPKVINTLVNLIQEKNERSF